MISNFKNQPVIRDKKWLSDCHNLPCVCTNQQTAIVTHHLLRCPSRRGFRRSGDNHILPMTDAKHKELHNMGDEKKFFEDHGVSDPVGLAEKLYANRHCLNSCIIAIHEENNFI
tara:strand:- start:159 stop:500 length:342 start_codon:yes stop_codon:yes gene_type:complete